MTTEQIKEMVLELVQELDYDHYKNLVPETAEEPEEAEQELDRLVQIAARHIDAKLERGT